MQGEAHLTFSALSCSHRRNSARKAIAAKTQHKGETRTKPSPVLSPTPQANCFLPKWRRLGIRLEKSSFPQGEPTEPIPECAIPNCSSYSSFSHCERLHSTSSLLLELLKGSAPTVCIALNNQDQVMSGIPRVMGSSQTRNNIPVLPQDGQSLLEQDSLHLQQSTARAEIVTEKCFAVF